MSVEHIIFALLLILGLSLLARPVSRLLLLLGYIASELFVHAGIDTGIRSDNFQSIIFYVLIPVLVFASALNIDKQQLKNNLVVILSLAIIAWGGLRGAVTLALALSLPTSLDYWWASQSIAFGVVTFSLFVQASTMQLLVGKLSFKQ